MKLLVIGAMAFGLTGAMTLPADAEDPFSKSDRSWISLSGVVAATSNDSFVLDYGEGLITVEMDDWDWYGLVVGIESRAGGA